MLGWGLGPPGDRVLSAFRQSVPPAQGGCSLHPGHLRTSAFSSPRAWSTLSRVSSLKVLRELEPFAMEHRKLPQATEVT